MITLEDIAGFLDTALHADRVVQEHSGLLRDADSAIERLGLALEAGPETADWAEQERLDALFLHRAGRLDRRTLPPGIGILSYHLPFDLTLTTGWNPRLADALGLSELEGIGEKQGGPIGMLGNIRDCPQSVYFARVGAVFGGWEDVFDGGRDTSLSRVAVVGAMTDALVREASARGADLYLTGQMRPPGHAAMRETGMGVIAVGQERGERWGLRALSHILRERFWNLDTVLTPPGQDMKPHPD